MLHALLTHVPPALDRLNPAAPPLLARVVSRLLAKDPAQRYQSAWGLRCDLQRVAAGEAAFELGTDDGPIAPRPPAQLIGRQPELSRLRQALKAQDGRRRMVAIKGVSGSGKSSLMHAAYPWVSELGGWVAEGKQPQFQRLNATGGPGPGLVRAG